MGVKAISPGPRGGRSIASFPVELSDQIMLATSTGQSIRVPVDQVSFRSRSAGGVRVFSIAADEEVVSVARVADQGPEAE
jgi:DNA gyrase subunit A